MVEDAGHRSLILVVDYYYMDKGPYFCSILQLDVDVEALGDNHENEVIETEFSVNFCQPHSQLALPIIWKFSPLAISTEDLYMVPDMLPHELSSVPLNVCIYNLRNNTCKQIKTPEAPKHGGHAVSLGGHLYLMAHPREKYLSSPVFERHDPSSDCWEPREPFPFLRGIPGVILATAVLDDTILFNISNHNICAYNVPNNKWHRVITDDDRQACRIRGEAVVLGNTIYALEDNCFNLVLVFSVGSEEVDDDLVFRFSLVTKILVSGMKQIEDEDKDVLWHSHLRNLAYLGNNYFCLVRGCELTCPKEYQSIQVINMKLEGENSMTVNNTRFYKFKLDDCKTEFRVRLCFSSLLKRTTPPAKDDFMFIPNIVKFDPFPKHTRLKREREDSTDCLGDHADTTLEVLNPEAPLLQTQTQATPTPAFPAYCYNQHPAYHYPQAPAIPSPPPYYQHPAYHYPQAPATPSPPPCYQNTAYHYPQAPAILSPPPYYQHPRPHPPNTPHPWPSNPQQPLGQCPPKPYQDYCQLCGLQGHFATNCSTFSYYKNQPTPPWSTTVNPLYS